MVTRRGVFDPRRINIERRQLRSHTWQAERKFAAIADAPAARGRDHNLEGTLRPHPGYIAVQSL